MKIALRRRTCLQQSVLVVNGNAIEPANNFSACSLVACLIYIKSIGAIADRKHGVSCNNLHVKTMIREEILLNPPHLSTEKFLQLNQPD